MNGQEIVQRLRERFGEKVTELRVPGSGQTYAAVDRDHVRPVLEFLKTDPDLAFNLLADVTVVDHLLLEMPGIGERFAVVYQLHSLRHNHRFQLKARVPGGDPVAPSAHGLWRSALWAEREAHDMYGVEFDGNPDMRRLLMPEDYPGFPLRKDYPLRGRGERDVFPQIRSAPAVEAGKEEDTRRRTGGL
jgi:NADH-quinone oxidoreductase subunit C